MANKRFLVVLQQVCLRIPVVSWVWDTACYTSSYGSLAAF